MPAPPDWLWIVLTLGAAAAQTARNTLQRDLTAALGALGAAHARFLYGFPFALLFLLGFAAFGVPLARPTAATVGWAAVGGLAQIGATALMLSAMRHSAFVIVVAWTKAEPLVVLAVAWAVLGETPTAVQGAAIALATLGVMLMSWPAAGQPRALAPLMLGLGAAALFALSAVAFRRAILATEGAGFLGAASVTLVLALAMQAGGLSLWLALRDPAALRALVANPLKSAPAGFFGALASQGWFLAFAVQTTALVRTLALVEIPFSQIVTRRWLKQAVAPREVFGMAVLAAGLAGLFLGA
jgi:drug/metabolite transporter (DMT)-like permease